MRLVRSLAVAAFLALPSASFAGAIVVDPQGLPGGGILLQNALDAAVAGDVVIVRAGDYSGFLFYSVTGKGITIVDDSGGLADLTVLLVTQVPAGQTFVLRGFHFSLGSQFFSPSIAITNSPGAIVLEDCVVVGTDGHSDYFGLILPGSDAVSVTNVSSLAIERCQLFGGKGSFDYLANRASAGGAALVLKNSTATVHDSLLNGGPSGGQGTVIAGTPDGGDGVVLQLGSHVLMAGCSAQGGAQFAVTSYFPCTSGAGLQVDSGDARVRNSTIIAGSCCPGGIQAPDVIAPVGAVTTFTTPTTSLAVSTPVVSGNNATITLTGPAGNQCALFLGVIGPALLVPSAQGSFLVGGAAMLGPYAVGTIHGSGVLSIVIPTPPLPAAVPDAFALALQAAVFAPSATLEAASIYVQIRPGL